MNINDLSEQIKRQTEKYKRENYNFDNNEDLFIDIKNAAFFYATKQLINIEDKNIDLKDIFNQNYEFYMNLIDKLVIFYSLKSDTYNEFQNTLSTKERNLLTKPELDGIIYLSKNVSLLFNKSIVKEIRVNKKKIDLNLDIFKEISNGDKNVTGLNTFETSVLLMFKFSNLEIHEFQKISKSYHDNKFIHEELLRSVCKKLILDDKELGSKRAIAFLTDYNNDLEFKNTIIEYTERNKKEVNVRKRKKN